MKKNRLKDGRFFNIFCYGFLFVAIAYSFGMVFFGLDFKDTFYFCCEYQYSGKTMVLLPFTQGAFLLIQSIFGDSIVAYRIINWLVYFAGYALAWCFLRICNLGSKGIRALLFAFMVALIPNVSINVFNGNQFSALFLICTFIAFYLYENRDRRWLYGVVLFVVLGALARFPNVVVIPMILFVGIFVCRGWKDYLRIVAAMAVAVLLYLVICSVVFHGFRNFLDAMSISFGLNPNSSEPAAHSVSDLFEGYLISLRNVVRSMKYLSVIVLIPLLSFCCKKRWKSFIVLIAFFIALLAFVKIRVGVLSEGYYLLNLYIYASVFIVTFVICVLALLRHDLKDFGWSVAPILFSLCAAAGSDTGLFLMGGPLYAFTPFLIIKMMNMLKVSDKNEFMTLAMSLVVLAIGSACYVREGLAVIGAVMLAILLVSLWFVPIGKIQCASKIPFSPNNADIIVWCIFGVLVINLSLSAYARCNVSFSDKPLRELTCQYEDQKLRHVWTSPGSVGFVEDVLSEYREVSENRDVVFYGRASFVFSYLAEQSIIPGSDFSQEGELNIRALQKALESRPVVFLIPDNPALENCYDLEKCQKEDEMLRNAGYACENMGTFAVYKPIDIN